jgi:hypothetical protein
MMEPRDVEDEGHERIVERVAAIDMGKASGMVCVRVPHGPGRAGGSAGSGRWRPHRRGHRAG